MFQYAEKRRTRCYVGLRGIGVHLNPNQSKEENYEPIRIKDNATNHTILKVTNGSCHKSNDTQDIYYIDYIDFDINESNRKAMNRNWSNQKAYPALKTKAGNK